MRCLFSTIFSVISLVLLAAGAFLLFTVFIDTPETLVDTVGGASRNYQQAVQEIVASGGDEAALESAELPVVVDGQTSTSNAQGGLSPNSRVFSNSGQGNTNSFAAVPTVDPEVARQNTDNLNQLDVETSATGANVAAQNEIINSESEVAIVPLAVPNTASVNSAASDTVVPGQGGSGGGLEQRVVELEWPEEFRTGESGVLRITLRPLPDGGLELVSPEISTNAVVATPIGLQNCYGDYDAYVTASIVAPRFDIDASDEATKLMPQGGEVSWRWTLTADSEGRYVITVALRMDWRLKVGAQELPGVCSALAQSDYTFWGQSLQVEVNRVLGLITIDQASLAGTVLALLGVAGQIPFFGEILALFFERRIKRRADRRRQRRAKKRRR